MGALYFHDRKEAGLQLAQRLSSLKKDRPVIMALPRGGVPVAAEIARYLQAPLELLMVRKLGVPGNPELAMGAVTEDRTTWLNEDLIHYLEINKTEISSVIAEQLEQIEEQIKKYRGSRKRLDVKNKVVVLVDDGLATGATMHAAVLMLRKQNVKRVIAAVPVAATASANELRGIADEVIALVETENFISVGSCYEDFAQISDEQVVALLGPSD